MDAAAEDMMGGEEEEEPYEWVSIDNEVNYLGPLLRLLAFTHTMISFCMLLAYYVLKVMKVDMILCLIYV